MKQVSKIALLSIAILSVACRSSDYNPSCKDSSDPSCKAIIATIGSPSGLQVAATAFNKIKVSWTNPSYSGDFVIVLEMKENGNENFKSIQVLDAKETSFEVNNLEPLTKYFFRVKAMAAANDSDYTAEADATTLEQTVNALFPKPTSTISNYAIGVIKVANTWSNTTYASWVASVQYQHKKENGGEWETIGMGTYAAMSAQLIDNAPPKGYAVYRMKVTYTDQSVYTTAPSAHIMAILEAPTDFAIEVTQVDGVTKHAISWAYGTVPSEMAGFEILAYFPNLTQVGPSGTIDSTLTSMNYIPDPCPTGTIISYWMRAKSNLPLVASSNVTPTITKPCP